jgi:hypothetical protein
MQNTENDNGQQYFKKFEQKEGNSYVVKNETNKIIEIELRPGLLSNVVAAKQAKMYSMN